MAKRSISTTAARTPRSRVSRVNRTERSVAAKPLAHRQSRLKNVSETPSSGRSRPAGEKPTAKRGFAAMSLQKRREIARKGVRARRAA